MKRLITAVALLSLWVASVIPGQARAAETDMPAHHPNGSLGFRDTDAPIGVRWWLGEQRVGIDLGLGIGSDPASGAYPNDHLTHWAVDVGVPFVLKSWSRVHVIARPGLLYRSQQVEISPGPPAPFNTDNATLTTLNGEIETEVFLVDNVSLSASEGLAYNSFNPVGPGRSVSNWGTTGRNFTTLGFHVYFMGGGQ